MKTNYCKLVMDRWGDKIRQAVEETKKDGLERGFMLCRGPKDNPGTCVGDECQIHAREFQEVRCRSGYIGTLHTHPLQSYKPHHRKNVKDFIHIPSERDLKFAMHHGIVDDGVHRSEAAAFLKEGCVRATMQAAPFAEFEGGVPVGEQI